LVVAVAGGVGVEVGVSDVTELDDVGDIVFEGVGEPLEIKSCVRVIELLGDVVNHGVIELELVADVEAVYDTVGEIEGVGATVRVSEIELEAELEREGVFEGFGVGNGVGVGSGVSETLLDKLRVGDGECVELLEAVRVTEMLAGRLGETVADLDTEGDKVTVVDLVTEGDKVTVLELVTEGDKAIVDDLLIEGDKVIVADLVTEGDKVPVADLVTEGVSDLVVDIEGDTLKQPEAIPKSTCTE